MLRVGSGSIRGGRVVVAGAIGLSVLIAAVFVGQAQATITQGDFEVFGSFSSRWSGRWGEGGAKGGQINSAGGVPLAAARESGGSFDFAHWDLVQARQVADIRPGYHLVKNYNMLGRFDTFFIKDASLFAIYRGWYDAFDDLKHRGRVEPNRDWMNYNNRTRQQQFVRDDLREFYAQINVTDNFSMRLGKQQVIWTEADALSGTETTNPSDLRFHWIHFEAPEDLRKNVRMAKFDYILPDFLKTANNEFQFFWIPGDWQGLNNVVNATNVDARSPYVFFGPLTRSDGIGLNPVFNQKLQLVRQDTFADSEAFPVAPSPFGGGAFVDVLVPTSQNTPRNSIDNSEFGARYSTLLPIGNGLQMSLIYLYEARFDKEGFCINCHVPFSGLGDSSFIPLAPFGAPGVFVLPGVFTKQPHNPAIIGTLEVDLRDEVVRQHFLGVTGTYYDKDLTDVVIRYDAAYRPKVGINLSSPTKTVPAGSTGARWTEEAIFIIAFDRPTYIPWISKQHTFLVAQETTNWWPDRPSNAVPFFGSFQGKTREIQNLGFVSAVNWIFNGRLITTNTALWDWDDTTGSLSSTSTFRFRRNVLLAFNAQWYLGRSGRWTDPFALSRYQRANELEFRFTYEL